MTVESATYLSSLVPANPPDTDPEGEGAAHLRLIKSTLKTTLPNLTGPVTATQVSLNAAGALQPTGAGPVMVPAVASTGSVVTLQGLAGQSTANLTNLNGTLSVAITDTSGANPVSVLQVDRTGSLYVKGTLVSFVGEIRIWGGLVGTIPTGWHLCDGTNGTPDLRDRFVAGAGGSYAPGDAGGLATVTLSASQMPVHTHTAFQDPHGHNMTDPGHIHTGATDVQGAHQHNYVTAGGAGVGNGGTYADAGNGTTNRLTDIQGSHQHSFTTSVGYAGMNVDIQQPAISVLNAGSGAAHENRPPYFALAYIMRIT